MPRRGRIRRTRRHQPSQARSGRTIRYRLNRGADSALNRAIHTIAVTRMRCCSSTQAYVARRRTEGNSDKEIMRRCLKRYIAHLLRTLSADMAVATRA